MDSDPCVLNLLFRSRDCGILCAVQGGHIRGGRLRLLLIPVRMTDGMIGFPYLFGEGCLQVSICGKSADSIHRCIGLKESRDFHGKDGSAKDFSVETGKIKHKPQLSFQDGYCGCWPCMVVCHFL